MVEVKPIDVSCSSQDPAFPALNLVRGALKPSDERKQWLCSSPDEKFAHVTLTYEKPFVISSLEIKNNGSAYVQVEGCSSQEPGKYKVLWKTQNLMTPSESRLGTDADGIYIFLPQDLATAEKDKTWDMLKITCSQPFNKLQKYGLSHVVARSALPVKEEIPSSPSHCAADLPIRSLKREPVEEDRANPVPTQKNPDKVVEHQNQMSSEVSSSGCSETSIPFNSPVKQENPPADEVYYPQRSEASSSGSGPSQSLNQQSDMPSPPIKRENSIHIIADSRSAEDETVVGNSSPLKRHISESESESDANSDETQIIKRPAPSVITYKPFNKLLEGVKIVISGFQNPYRAEIRNRAIQMGASYSPNWTELSTHLICAFLNTPKYRQAAADHGLIVTRDWIDQCYIQRKRLPWKRFALNPSERSFDSTGVEIWELVPSTTNSSTSFDTRGSSISPRNTERSMESSPAGGVHNNSLGHCPSQNGSPSTSSSHFAQGLKKEVSDHGDCLSNSLCLMQEVSSADGTSRHSILRSGFVLSPRHDVSVKREVNVDEAQDSWQDSANILQGPSPVSNTASEHGQFRRSQASTSSPRPQLHYNSTPGTSGNLEHETLRSTSSMEPSSDGYAGYYRPISQPCAVPHSSPSTTYLVPPVIMLPQSLPQYFVPVSQQFQAPPSSRDTYMARRTQSPQVQGQHIRVIQHSNKAVSDDESSKQSENM